MNILGTADKMIIKTTSADDAAILWDGDRGTPTTIFFTDVETMHPIPATMFLLIMCLEVDAAKTMRHLEDLFLELKGYQAFTEIQQ